MSVLDGLTSRAKAKLRGRQRAKYKALLKTFGLEDEEAFMGTFPKVLEVIKEMAQAEILQNNDFVILVTGPTGQGKSTLCQEIAHELDIDYSHMTNTSMRTEERFKLNIDLPPGSIHVMEEMGVDANKMSYRTSQGQDLKMMFQTNRKKNHVQILNLPEVEDLMGYLFDKRTKVWIHVVTKGMALIFFAQEVILFGNQFGLQMSEMSKVTKHIVKESHAVKFINNYLRERESCEGFFHFPQYTAKFTKELYEDYEERIIKTLNKIYKEKKDFGGSELNRYKGMFEALLVKLYSKYSFSAEDLVDILTIESGPLIARSSIFRILKKHEAIKNKTNYGKSQAPVIQD